MADSETNEPTGSAPASGQGAARAARLFVIVTTVVLIVVLAVAAICYQKVNDDDDDVTQAEAALVNKDLYQTVFLTNGQVYFGKLQQVNPDFYKLTDIYYLQVQQSVQPSGSPSNNSNSNTNTTAPADASQTQLVKLGDELHAPEDSMQINRAQVQFWENIKNDGKVAQAIAEYKKK